MTSPPEDSASSYVELPLCRDLQCRIYSEQPLQRWHNEDCSVLVLGSARLGNEPASAERIARAWLDERKLERLYPDLSGVFCIALYDRRQDSLYLMPDFMGIQSCYHTRVANTLLLSDSLDRLHALPETNFSLSDQALFDYFYFHCIPSPGTIYTECAKLEPGKALAFEASGGKTPVNLFHPGFADDGADQQALQSRCLAVIDEAVAQCATDSSGAFLSGGLDSSTVAGMLARHQEPARTFSIGFESPDYDETPYARITARHFGTRHEVLYLSAEDAARELVNIAQYFDEPFGNSSAMAAYFCARFAREQGVDTLLAGDGGDELFAGNGHYARQKQFELFCALPAWLQSLLRLALGNDVAAKLPLASKAASYIRQADIPLPDRLGTYNFVQRYGVDNMFDADFLQRVDASAPFDMQRQRYADCSSEDPINRMLYLDWKFTLADNDLVKVKKMCEKAGVKVHFPLLDRRVVEFSCEVPARMKIPGFRLRDFYKKACRGFLAEDTLSKRKHGFGLPFGLWMKENAELQQLSRECIDRFRGRGILNDALIDDALRSHETVHASYYGELIWIIVTLELWLQRKS